MTRAAALAPTHEVGPLRVGGLDVTIRTNCAAFAAIADTVFVDLLRPAGVAATGRHVVFNTIRHETPSLRWGIDRDGQPCELDLRDDAVLLHQQWELNRLVIESQRAVVHAAAVTLDGRGILLAGLSHSGKTTLAGWLAVHHHFGYIADEAAAIDEQARVRPFVRPLGLRSGSPLTAPERSRGRLAQRFMPDEQLVPASTLGCTLQPAPTPAQLIVFPHFRPNTEPVAMHLTQSDAIERLASLTPGLAQHGATAFRRLVALVSTGGVVDVSYGHVSDAADLVLDALHRSPEPR